MSCSFTYQVLAELDLLENLMITKAYKNISFLLPKELDEKVAKSHFPALRAELVVLTSGTRSFYRCQGGSPFKDGHYHY